MDAYQELMSFLEPNESVEAIVFGPWGWSSGDELATDEPDPPIPLNKRGTVLTLTEAEPFMHSWCFHGGFGAPDSYAVSIWTNKRVLFVSQYDGLTSLNSVPRNPIAHIPDMPGG